MDQKTFFTQALRYQKAISETAFSLLSVAQHSGAEMLKQSLDHHSWLPVSGKKSCLYWSEQCIQATDQLRSIMEKGFEQVEKQLSPVSPYDATIKTPSKPASSSQQTVKTSVQESAPLKSPGAKSVKVEKSAKVEVTDVVKDSAPPSGKQPAAAQKDRTSAAPKTTKAATKSKSVASRAKSATTKAKSTTSKAKSTATRKTGTAATTRKASTAKSKPSVAASSTAASKKGTAKPKTAAKKTTTKSAARPASKQSN